MARAVLGSERTPQTFTIYPVDKFKKPDAQIKRPRELTYFSFDEEHVYKQDASGLRYWYPPNLPADLSKGFDKFRNLDDSKDDHLDSLLQSIINHERETKARVDTDFVTWRGMMTKIMTVPYANLDEWEMNVTKFQGTIFIEENHEAKIQSRTEQYQRAPHAGAMSQDLMSYWGYKFESLCLLDKHWCHTDRTVIEGREEAQVSNYAQYCSVVKTGFGSNRIIIGGEVDAVMDNKPTEPGASVNWVELKTSAEIINDKDLNKYERKLLKFWAQSFLLGVPKVIVGFRDQQGMLLRLKELETQKIPQMLAGTGRKLWEAQICINFANAFLDFLKQHVQESDGVYRIRKKSKGTELALWKTETRPIGAFLSNDFIVWRAETLPKLMIAESERESDPVRSIIRSNQAWQDSGQDEQMANF